MLPGFRLIAATFLCGFAIVFVGLRLASSLHDVNVGLPVMVAHAAPISVAAVADNEMRRGRSAVPVMYDMRFAVSSIAHTPTLANLAPLIDRTAPLGPLLMPADEPVGEETSAPAEFTDEPDEIEDTIAATPPETQPAAAPEPAAPVATAPEPTPPQEAAADPKPTASIAPKPVPIEPKAKPAAAQPKTAKPAPRIAKPATEKPTPKKPIRVARRAAAAAQPAASAPAASSGEAGSALNPFGNRIE